jgi:hypothetical protein
MNEFKMIGELRRKSIGFWIALFLSLAEAGYSYVIVHRMSSLGEPFRTAQALFIAVLLDLAVLYFTLFAPKEREHIARFFLIGMLSNIVLAQVPWNVIVHYVAVGFVAIEIVSAIYFFSEMTLIQHKDVKKAASRAPQVKVSAPRTNTPAKPKVAQKPANELEQDIVKLYTTGDGLSFREIARQLGTNHKKVSRTLEKINGNAVVEATQ